MADLFVRVGTIKQSNPIVDSDGRPTSWFTTALNTAFGNLAAAINQLAALPEIQQALADAQAAAAAANQAAMDAQAAADQAQSQADATAREAALTASYIEPDSVITADDVMITVMAHTRMYADGTSAAVSGGTVPVTAPGDVDYVSYLDPTRSGGTVTYIASTTAPVQTGDTHVVGAVQVPNPGDPPADGGSGPARPGKVEPLL